MTRLKQTLLLNSNAMLLHSCDTLFATDQLMNESILPCFPFLESVFEDLLVRLKTESTIIFKGIETKHAFLPGYYDYVFSFNQLGENTVIQWQIVDETEIYNALKIVQQSSHEKSAFSGRNSPNCSL